MLVSMSPDCRNMQHTFESDWNAIKDLHESDRLTKSATNIVVHIFRAFCAQVKVEQINKMLLFIIILCDRRASNWLYVFVATSIHDTRWLHYRSIGNQAVAPMSFSQQNKNYINDGHASTRWICIYCVFIAIFQLINNKECLPLNF